MTADSGASNVHAEYVGEGMIMRERGREMSFSIAQIGAQTQTSAHCEATCQTSPAIIAERSVPIE